MLKCRLNVLVSQPLSILNITLIIKGICKISSTYVQNFQSYFGDTEYHSKFSIMISWPFYTNIFLMYKDKIFRFP